MTQVTVGASHACILMASGTIRCWGGGASGALGYGNRDVLGDDESLTTLQDVRVGGRVIQVVVGFAKTCALMDGGGVRCWGDPPLGYPSNVRVGDKTLPESIGDISLGGKATQLAAGGFTVCALLDDSSLRCWGHGGRGSLGTGNQLTVGDDEPPAKAGKVDVGGKVLQVSAGTSHTCAVLDGGRVRCWGAGEYGQLGYGNTNDIGDDETPASAGDVNVGGEVVQIAAGGFHTCALLKTGCGRCWGLNDRGQLGYGNTTNVGDDEMPFARECVAIF